MFLHVLFQKMQVDLEEPKQEEAQPTQAETKSNPEEMEVLKIISLVVVALQISQSGALVMFIMIAVFLSYW